jgi:hypothetical protein
LADKAALKKGHNTKRGGACRAFFGYWWANHMGTTQDGHIEYQAIVKEDGERLAYWKTAGQAGTQQAHAGNPHAFGPPKKEKDRDRKRRGKGLNLFITFNIYSKLYYLSANAEPPKCSA